MTKDQEDFPQDDLQEEEYEPRIEGQIHFFSLKIPLERVAVLIGKKGEEKKKIEDMTRCKLRIDSKEGEVEISTSDPIMIFSARDIVKAVGRGFNPEVALQLIKQDYGFEQINLTEYVKHKNHFGRIRGRIIGRDGKARENIEQLTDTFISVYGKTVCIIGRMDNIMTAKRAIESLIQGSPHSNVYKWLEKRRREAREAELKDEAGF